MSRRLIDLTMTIQEGMQTFATHWHPFVEISQLGRFGIENRETRKITLGTHTGTHIDAPRHFIPGGLTIERISLEQLNGPATVLDFSALPDKTEISTEVLKKALKGRPVGRLLCRFDWDKKALGTNRYYEGHPYFSQAACRWLVEQGCQVIASDTPQPDNPKHGRNHHEFDAPNHKILLGSGVIIAECLVNMAALAQPVVDLVIGPIKLLEGDGAPSRIFAFEEE